MSWRDEILDEFQPDVARVTLAADPDGLLLEEGILRGIEERGFYLIPFEDPIAFRYAYESRFRSHWDRGESTELVVVLRSPASDLRTLPHDLLQAGRTLSFRLADLFPKLSLPVVEELDPSDLHSLYDAQARHHLARPLSVKHTRTFVLRHVFKVAPETIRTESDLLGFLMERHYKGLRVSPSLDEHLIAGLKKNPEFEDWPLDVVVPDRDSFLRFLQERWPIFLDGAGKGRVGGERQAHYALQVPGQEDLPFDHSDVRVYLDNYFLEGLLEPVSHPRSDELEDTWASAGIRRDPDDDLRRRWDGLVDAVASNIPEPAAGHRAWQAFAARWARLIALRWESEQGLDAERLDRFKSLQSTIDEVFLGWVGEHYGTLHNQPPDPPVMIHHVPRMLARRLADSGGKIALVLVDGLSLDQWTVAQQGLDEQDLETRVQEDVVFAWVPTVTPVSRQACFAGRPPLYFPRTITRTSHEPKLWTRFWVGQGLAPEEVAYAKSIRRSSDLGRVEELLSRPRTRAVGLVVDQVDRISHGMELGTSGMHNQVRQWVETGVLAKLLTLLLEHGFEVFLTSDHGNVEARGIGRPSEGAVADVRGERVRVFPNTSLRDRIQGEFPGAIAWPPVGLPDSYFPLLAPGRSAFVPEGDVVVGHGGITVEEVLVPLIQFEAK